MNGMFVKEYLAVAANEFQDCHAKGGFLGSFERQQRTYGKAVSLVSQNAQHKN
jgi:hypothetical protein